MHIVVEGEGVSTLVRQESTSFGQFYSRRKMEFAEDFLRLHTRSVVLGGGSGGSAPLLKYGRCWGCSPYCKCQVIEHFS